MLVLIRRLMTALALVAMLLSTPGIQADPTRPPASERPASRPASRPTSAPASRPTWLKPTRLRIQFQNRVGALFKLVQLVVVLDGVYLYKKSDNSGILDRSKNLLVFDGAVAPVAHTVMVKLVYRGTGLGLFTYQREYKYTLRRAHQVPANYGGRTTVIIRGYQRGNLFWRQGNRLTVGFEVKEPGTRNGRAP